MKSLSLLLITVLVISSMQSGILVSSHLLKSSILYVGGSGEGNFSSIMDAVEDDVDGDSFLV